MTPSCPNCWPYRPCRACGGGVVRPKPRAGRRPRCLETGDKTALLDLVEQHDWNLTRAAKALNPPAKAARIVYALLRHAPAEYEAAKREGLVRAGRPVVT